MDDKVKKERALRAAIMICEEEFLRPRIEWLSLEIANQYYERARKLPENSGQDIGAWRELRIELQKRCGILEIEAFNILRGFYIDQYVHMYERRAGKILSEVEIVKSDGNEELLRFYIEQLLSERVHKEEA